MLPEVCNHVASLIVRTELTELGMLIPLEQAVSLPIRVLSLWLFIVAR